MITALVADYYLDAILEETLQYVYKLSIVTFFSLKNQIDAENCPIKKFCM